MANYDGSEYTHFQFLGRWDLFKEIYIYIWNQNMTTKKRIPVLVGDLAWSLVSNHIIKRHVPLEIWSFPNGVIDFVKGYSSQSGLKLETHKNLQVSWEKAHPTK